MGYQDQTQRNAYQRSYYRANKAVINKELAMKVGLSKAMVAWYRRKAGIVLRKRAA